MDVNWNERYLRNDVPWDTNQPSSELQRVLEEYNLQPGRALDLGCGTGSNAVYLARRGFEVTGVDLAPAAIAAADRRADVAGVNVRFITADVFALPDLGPPFDLIFDRGCFHVVRLIDEAAAVGVLRSHIAPGGHLLVLTGNASEKDAPEGGPPRATAEELRHAFAGLELIHLRAFQFDKVAAMSDYRPLAWSLLARNR